MQGETVVITGATSGIGGGAAKKLAQMGARIVLVARDRSRDEGALRRLRKKAPGLSHAVHDLTRISEMKRVAAEIAEAEPRIDVPINNAGAIFAARKLTEDGLEYTFALNHMAYFVVTQGLRERLKTASFGAMKAYGRSKLCNILFTRELVRRLHGTGVTANCLHPGFVATRFGDEIGGLISILVGLAKLLRSPRRRARKRSFISRHHPRSPRRRANISITAARLRRRERRRMTGLRYRCGSAAPHWRARRHRQLSSTLRILCRVAKRVGESFHEGGWNFYTVWRMPGH